MIPRFKYSFNLLDFIYSITHYSKENTTNLVEYFENNNLYSTNYARTGLLLILKSLTKQSRLRVGVQAFTCHTILEAIKKAGCEFFFLDVNDNYTLDLRMLQAKISAIDVLIVTHTFGIPADISKILSIAKDKIIIEDCAHALFTKFNNRQVGTFGDAAIFSIGYGKYPSIGPGGVTIINNQDLNKSFLSLYNDLNNRSIFAEIKNVLKNYIYSVAFSNILYGLITHPLGKKLDEKYDFIGKKSAIYCKGFKSNINLFNRNLSKYERLNKIQIENGLYFESKIAEFFEVNSKRIGSNNFYVFPLRHWNRDKIVEVLFRYGFESGKHFAKSIEWAEVYGYQSGECPCTEKIIKEIFTIPIHFDLCSKKIDIIANILRKLAK